MISRPDVELSPCRTPNSAAQYSDTSGVPAPPNWQARSISG